MTDSTTPMLTRVGTRFYHLALYPDRVEYREPGAQAARETIPLATITSVDLTRIGGSAFRWTVRVTAGLQSVAYQPVTYKRGEAFRRAVNQAILAV